VADGKDNDCNGCVDDVDDDRDRWTECPIACDSNGDGSINEADRPCSDCDDTNAEEYPGAPEIPYDDIDQDCDGFDECDADEDGYDATSAAGPGCSGYDCNDQDTEVHPGAIENDGNGIDDDCDGIVDLPDSDSDGFTVEDGDCMDLGPDSNTAAAVALSKQVNPGAQEVCFDQVDNDCDGWIDNLPECEWKVLTATVRGGGLCATSGGEASLLALAGLALAARRRRLA